jgi:hypothetical protein
MQWPEAATDKQTLSDRLAGRPSTAPLAASALVRLAGPPQETPARK